MSLLCCLSTNSFFRSFSHWRHNTEEKLVYISEVAQLSARLTGHNERPELSTLSILLWDCWGWRSRPSHQAGQTVCWV